MDVDASEMDAIGAPRGIAKPRATKPRAKSAASKQEQAVLMHKQKRPPPSDTCDIWHNRDTYVELLEQDGYVVVPFLNREQLANERAAFDNHFLHSPELNKPDLDDPEWTPQLGGFAALGYPSSFHHPFHRRIDELMLAQILDLNVLPLNGRRVEKCFDRLLFRRKNKSPTVEAVHRDSAPRAVHGDDVFGGWLNLDEEDQIFLTTVGTHREEWALGRNGFDKIKDPAEVAKYDKLIGQVTIPAGHILIFYERLVHKVASTPAPRDMRRVHFGVRLTKEYEPLFGTKETKKWIDTQAVPRIKSSQWPHVFPTVPYTSYPNDYAKVLEDWSKRVFKQELHMTYSPNISNPLMEQRDYTRVPTHLPSLRSLNTKHGNDSFRMHPGYDIHETMLHWPTYQKDLYTLDSGEKRITFRLPSSTDYERYQAGVEQIAKQGLDGVSVPRPAPLRVGNDYESEGGEEDEQDADDKTNPEWADVSVQITRGLDALLDSTTFETPDEAHQVVATQTSNWLQARLLRDDRTLATIETGAFRDALVRWLHATDGAEGQSLAFDADVAFAQALAKVEPIDRSILARILGDIRTWWRRANADKSGPWPRVKYWARHNLLDKINKKK